MNRFNITKIYKLTLVFSLVLAVLLILFILSNGLDYDVIFIGGTNLEYRVDTNELDEIYNDILSLDLNQIKVTKSTLYKEGIISINIDRDVVNKEFIEEVFKEKDFFLLREQGFSSAVGRQFALKFLIITIAFIILILISSIFIYKDIGGVTNGISLAIGVLSNIISLLGVFSIFKIKLGGSIFVFATISTIVSCYNFIIIFSKIKEIEETAPVGIIGAETLLNKGVIEALPTVLLSLISAFVIIISASTAVIIILGFNVGCFLPLSILAILLPQIGSIFLSPSIWYLLNSNKTF